MTNLTNQIKASLLSYYKWHKGAKLVATEVPTNHGIGDVLIMTKSLMVYEIEIKISVSDLKNELKKVYRNKAWEQWKLSNNEPNKYYFCVPSKMINETVDFVTKLNNKYGVIEYTANPYLKRRFKIVKKAQYLNKLYNNYEDKMIQRINNDLCKRYNLLYPINK